MKTPLAIILIAVALVVVSTLAIMNNACKTGRHESAPQRLPYGIT